MDSKHRKPEIPKVEEPAASYNKSQKRPEKAFDFDVEFKNGYTAEQLKEEMRKRIKAYPWKK